MKRNPDQILDELLVLQAQDGDSKSIERLVNRWQKRFVRFAFQNTSDRELAVDVVQESWISIFKGIRKLRDPALFKSWAYRIVHNKSYDAIRDNVKRRTARETISQTTEASTSGDSVPLEQQSEIELLRDAISRLKPAERLLLTLFYEEDLSLKEIQQITGDSNSALKSRLFQVRQRLKLTLERKKNE